MIDFCTPDPKHPGFWICPENHGMEPHRKIDPTKYPDVMEQLAQVWDEGLTAGYEQAIGEMQTTFWGDAVNPYRVFTQDEK